MSETAEIQNQIAPEAPVETPVAEMQAADPMSAAVNALMDELQKHRSVVGVSMTLLTSDPAEVTRLQVRNFTILPPTTFEVDLQNMARLIEQNTHLSCLKAIPVALERAAHLSMAQAASNQPPAEA